MAEVDEIIERMRPILEAQGEKVAKHVETSTIERIDRAVAEKIPGAVNEAIKNVFDVDPSNRDEVRQVRQNHQFVTKLKKQTDEVGGHVFRFFLMGLFGLAGYGAYLKWWGK